MPGSRREAARVRASRAPTGAVRRVAGTRGLGGGYTAPSGLWSPSARSYILTGGEPNPADVWPASEAEAMGLPPFGRGVALLCNAVAGTEWQAVRFDAAAGVSMPRPDQPSVLTRPDPDTTPWHYRWAAIADLILYGNHFALCGSTDFVSRRPGWLVPVLAETVGVLTDPETGRYWFTVNGDAVQGYDPDAPPRASVDDAGRALGDWTGTLFHVSAGNRSGEILGLGVLAQYGAWLGGTTAAERHAGSYFAGGALPPAVLQSPTVLTQTQADELKTRWREMVSTREPVIMPSGYVLTPIVSDALNAQLVESRQWNAANVAMMLGIPSYKLGLAGPSMTYQNIESADIEFVRDSVDRYASPLSVAFSQYLMPAGTSVAWQYAGRMRADQKTTAEVVNSYVASGVLTPDEARQMLGRPPLPEAPEPPAPTVPDPTPEADAPALDPVSDSPESVVPARGA
jgi:phage portal protein BeeE